MHEKGGVGGVGWWTEVLDGPEALGLHGHTCNQSPPTPTTITTITIGSFLRGKGYE